MSLFLPSQILKHLLMKFPQISQIFSAVVSLQSKHFQAIYFPKTHLPPNLYYPPISTNLRVGEAGRTCTRIKPMLCRYWIYCCRKVWHSSRSQASSLVRHGSPSAESQLWLRSLLDAVESFERCRFWTAQKQWDCEPIFFKITHRKGL